MFPELCESSELVQLRACDSSPYLHLSISVHNFQFVDAWTLLDPEAEEQIEITKLEKLVMTLSPPLGVKDMSSSRVCFQPCNAVIIQLNAWGKACILRYEYFR